MPALNSPLFRVVALLAALYAIIGFFTNWSRPLGPFLLVLLSFFAGPYMALAFPFGAVFKVGYVAALLVAATLFVVGVVRFKRASGPAAFLAGLALWFFCGLIGLGTGS